MWGQTAARSDGPARAVLLALFFTFVSLVGHPFLYGADNNVFHIPIIQRAYDWPQFRDDAFYQSLTAYTSGVWFLVALFGERAAEPDVFAALHAIVRFLTFWSLLSMLAAFGLRPLHRTLAVAIFTGSALAYDYTGVGGQDLLLTSLSHTSLAWPLLFASLTLLARGRMAWAIGLNGLVFATNAFVAIWNGVALLLATLAHARLSNPRIGLAAFARSWAIGLLLALVLAAPVLFWILQNTTMAEPAFDYAGFLRSYWPYHFFIDASSRRDILILAATILMGAVALAQLDEPRRLLAATFVGYLLVFGFGVVLPWLSSSHTLLNLHLLRADGFLQLIALVASACVFAREILGPAPVLRRLTALAGAACLIIGGKLVVLALGALLVCGLWDQAPARLRSMLGFGAPSLRPAFVLALAGLLLIGQAAVQRRQAQQDPWLETIAVQRNLADWLRSHTPREALILSIPSARPLPAIELSELQLLSQRRLWVDWKRGAAVMWRPDYHAEWRARMDEVAALKTSAEKTAYACAHGADYLIETREDLARDPAVGRVIFTNQRYSVIDLGGVCSPAATGRS